ncbi:hypothetical protein quinque_015982 [Culex quinquefasciatus]
MPCKDSSKNLLDPSLLHYEGSNGATTENRGVRSAAHQKERNWPREQQKASHVPSHPGEPESRGRQHELIRHDCEKEAVVVDFYKNRPGVQDMSGRQLVSPTQQ